MKEINDDSDDKDDNKGNKNNKEIVIDCPTLPNLKIHLSVCEFVFVTNKLAKIFTSTPEKRQDQKEQDDKHYIFNATTNIQFQRYTCRFL